MSNLSELYQEVILDHTKNPRNRRKMAGECLQAEGYNPLCGDRVTLYVDLDDGRIRDLSFEGSGCAISTASVSLLTETLKGKTAGEAKKIFREFHDLVTGKNEAPSPSEAPPPLIPPPSRERGRGEGEPGEGGGGLGKLEVFAGVREYPMRVKCATLAWHTLTAALENRQTPVTTEGVED